MPSSELIEISIQGVVYYSQNDESALFEWLDKISCVEGYTPVSFNVNINKLDKHSLREIIACCYRYKADMRQLKAFDRADFKDLLAHWYKDIFE